MVKILMINIEMLITNNENIDVNIKIPIPDNKYIDDNIKIFKTVMEIFTVHAHKNYDTMILSTVTFYSVQTQNPSAR